VVVRTANGFVVAGRNIREVEIRESNVFKLAAWGWLAANLAPATNLAADANLGELPGLPDTHYRLRAEGERAHNARCTVFSP